MTRAGRLFPTMLASAVLLVWGLLPSTVVSGTLFRFRDVLRNDLKNRADYEQMEQGYYEQIVDAGRPVDRSMISGAGILAGHNESVHVEHGRLAVGVDDIREFVLKTNLSRDVGRDIPWSTNSLGMRDREYSVKKPAGTLRIALVGDSIAAGWGVEDEDGFEPRLERALCAHYDKKETEILNFAVPGHGPGQRWSHFSRVGWVFRPDLVLFEATCADGGWDERRLRGLLARGIGFDEPVYRDTLSRFGIKRGLDANAYKTVLRPLRWELLAGVYRAAAEECRARGVPIVLVVIPRVGKPATSEERSLLTNQAREAGFTAIVDTSDVYEGTDPRSLAIGPNDFHPNAQGHSRIAQALEPALTSLPQIAALWSQNNLGIDFEVRQVKTDQRACLREGAEAR